MNAKLIGTLKAATLVTMAALIPLGASAAPASKGKMSVPIISDAGTATQVSVDISVRAGSTGAPAGFSLQWMDTGDFVAANSVWPASDSLSMCKASFAGNANLSRYNLVAGEEVIVNIGDFMFDSGASTNCPGNLQCGHSYVFRGFAHATDKLQRSDFTGNTVVATMSCGGSTCRDPQTFQGNCTQTQGYWKTHGPVPTGNNVNEWTINGLTIGGVSYTNDQLQAIFTTPAAGNGAIALAHQLISALINQAQGASVPTDVAAAMASADALLTGVNLSTGGYLAPKVTAVLTTTIADYNEGGTGPGHCTGYCQ
jgi:hypothetical protein